MNWKDIYIQNNKPTFGQISEYINSPLWLKLNDILITDYNIVPQIEYSKCSMQRGWNIKYRKKGKSLCTLYPEQGYFKALIIISELQTEVNLFIETCCDYIKKLYHDTKFLNGSKWLMIEIDNTSILKDAVELIQFREK